MKVLVTGLGSIGQRHVRNLRKLLGDDLEISAWRTRRLKHVFTDSMTVKADSDVEKEYQLTIFSDLNHALAQEPDAVFVTNPSSLHLQTALQAAKAGCHLFIEKPLHTSLEGLDELAEEIGRQRLVALVGYQLRHHPALLLAKELLAAGVVGRLISVQLNFGEFLPGWHPYEDYLQSYAARSDMGGGVILTQIHDWDLVQWLFDMPRRVFASGGRISQLGIEVEDSVDALLECEYDGRPLPVSVHQDYIQHPPHHSCQVVGEKGTLNVDILTAEVQLFDYQNAVLRKYTAGRYERNQLFLDELSHFLACLREDATPSPSVEEAKTSLRIALAVRESLATHEVVSL